MRVLGITVFVVLAAIAVSATSYALAQKAAPAERVVMTLDQEAGALRVVIDGDEVARLDAGGLTVEGDLTYSGMITDGPARQKGPSP